MCYILQFSHNVLNGLFGHTLKSYCKKEWRIQLRFSSLDTYLNSFEHKTYSGDQDLGLFHVLGSRPCCDNHLSINMFLWKYANKGCVERTLQLLNTGIAHISFHRFVTFLSKFVYFKIGGLSRSLPVLCKRQNESYGVFFLSLEICRLENPTLEKLITLICETRC